jgi:hypothetical protein
MVDMDMGFETELGLGAQTKTKTGVRFGKDLYDNLPCRSDFCVEEMTPEEKLAAINKRRIDVRNRIKNSLYVADRVLPGLAGGVLR